MTPKDSARGFNGWISRIAVGGTALGASLLAAGTVWFAVSGGSEETITGSRMLHTLLAGLLAAEPLALLRLGVMVVLVLPPFLTAVGGVASARRGDWKDAMWSAAVLAILALSFLLADAG